MATKKMQAGGAKKKLTTNKRPIDLNLKERAVANRPLKGNKMQKGGKTTSFTQDIATGLDNVFRKTYPFNIPHTQTTKALKAVDDKITKGHEGEQPDWYNKFKDKVKKTMHVPINKKQNGGMINEQFSKATGIPAPSKKATKDTLKYVKKKGSGYNAPTKGKAPAGWSTREEATPSTRRYQNGGPGMTQPMLPPKPKTYPTGNKGIKGTPRPQIGGKGNEGYKPYANPPKPSMNAADYKAKAIARYGSEETARDAKAIQKKGGATKKMKIGGMVNPNANLKATATAGSRGVKSGINPKAAASKVVRGRSGGTSAAPKKALPKAQKGWSVDDPYKRGVMGAGATATKTSDRKTGGLSVIHGGTRTKTISAGGIYPGAKGSITKSKTDNKGKVTGSRTREISQEKANRMINRKRS